ncbi:hypothetical protein J416_06622 [Gracilibacillus halophilus YIM-C55.5]|uniref:DUF3231 family protein n=1 Tax=Gracilibacillus halophilus YIM-C55.5 TaxID=1308866 RepID=N4WAA6_9BACI|nr:DUF3231 family protein [Gracilibacillus halophilus]ENH97238.1 hypothetical protein J416_06622 [Gracilibacillus halophilus YIM-C55.5]
MDSSGSSEQMKEHQKHRPLTSAELGDLFANYLGDSLFYCVFTHHLEVVKDKEIKVFIESNLALTKKHLSFLRYLYQNEQIPVPVGFGEEDIRKEAPALFSDLFMVFYITEMSRAGVMTYGNALSTSSRSDIIEYFEMCIRETMNIYKEGINLLLSKGMDIAPPNIPYPKKVDFIEDQSFISYFSGKLRPLTGLEIKHLQINVNTNVLGKALLLGFSQVTSSEQLTKYFKQGSKRAEKQINKLGAFLMKENLPTPKLLDTHITDSTIPPYSDKLMLYHTSLASKIGIENFGIALSNVFRHDLHMKFASLTAGIAKYLDDGMNISICRGWLEEPPTAADRDKLSKKESGRSTEE